MEGNTHSGASSLTRLHLRMNSEVSALHVHAVFYHPSSNHWVTYRVTSALCPVLLVHLFCVHYSDLLMLFNFLTRILIKYTSTLLKVLVTTRSSCLLRVPHSAHY